MEQRLQKLLSAAGVASRRQAEQMIEAGRVTVNGQTAHLGQKADPDQDRIQVDGKRIQQPAGYRYAMLHKPRGVLSTMSDDRGRDTVAQLIASAGRGLHPVGRLDKDSEGLLLFTDDGQLTYRLTHPSHQVEKVYTVFVQGEELTASLAALRRLERLDGEPVGKVQVSLRERQGSRAELEMVLHEGKNRQIRRMCAACGLAVTRLIRIAEGSVRLGSLPVGQWRYLTREERTALQSL